MRGGEIEVINYDINLLSLQPIHRVLTTLPKTLSPPEPFSLTLKCCEVRQNYVTKEHSRKKAVAMT